MEQEQTIWIFRRWFNNHTKSNKPHVSHRFKVVWIKGGSGLWNIAGDLCAVSHNDIILLNNEEKRVIERVTSLMDLEFFIMELEPRFLFDTGLLPLFTEPISGYSHRIIHADRQLADILELILQESEQEESYSQIIIASSVMQLLGLAARKSAFPLGHRPRVNPVMKTVLAYIDQHYTQRIGLNELADIAHMSCTAFSRTFTKYNGIGPAQYIKRKRIASAIRLLEETDRTILDIAMDCGFRNVSNFYKAFHSLTRQVPSDYRRSHED
jgi:AraC-like DNA-binding protein